MQRITRRISAFQQEATSLEAHSDEHCIPQRETTFFENTSFAGDLADQVVALPGRNPLAVVQSEISPCTQSHHQTTHHQTNHEIRQVQPSPLSDLLQAPNLSFPLRYHRNSTHLHPVVPLFTDPKVWCPCSHQGVLCPFHPSQVALGILYPQVAQPEYRGQVGIPSTTDRPLYLGYAFQGFTGLPQLLPQQLREAFASDFRQTFQNRSPDLQLEQLFVVCGQLTPLMPFVCVIINPKKNGAGKARIIDDVVNQIGFTLQGYVSSHYPLIDVTFIGTMLKQKSGLMQSPLIYPWFKDSSTLEGRQMQRILCQIKQMLTQKRLKGKTSMAKFDFDQILSLNHFETIVTQKLMQAKPFVLEDAPDTFSLIDKDFQCLFAYATQLRDKITVLDENVTMNLERFLVKWRRTDYCQSLIQSRYNFPVSLFYPQNQTDSFAQIADQLRLTHTAPPQARTVSQFFEQVRGDIYMEFEKSYIAQTKMTGQLKYYAKRKNRSRIQKFEKMMSDFQSTQLVVPPELMQQYEQLTKEADDNKTIYLSEQEKRTLKAMFDVQVVPSLLVSAYQLLQQNLENYNMIELDPKLPRNMVYAQFMELIRKKYLPSDNAIKLFDTVLLSPEAELSFLMTANYISTSLLSSKHNGKAITRDFANLLLFGDSGTGKSFTLEALSQVLDLNIVSALTIQQMFRGNMVFAEKQIVNASCIVAHEVATQDLLFTGAKEYLDVSLSKRKINVKYADPISLTRGVPFLMGTNDFIGETSNFFEWTQLFKNLNQSSNRGLSSMAEPCMRRLTVIPYYDSASHWLKVKQYNQDFSLISSDGLDSNGQYLPYVLTLIGAAFMLNGRIMDYITTKEEAADYSRFMLMFESTQIGQRLKRMSETDSQLFGLLYRKYCQITPETAEIYKSKSQYLQCFQRDAIAFASNLKKFEDIRTEFQSEYKRLYIKFVRQDLAAARMFNAGFSLVTYRAVLYKIYVIAQFHLYRMVRHHGLIVNQNYLRILQFLQEVTSAVPDEIIINQNVEGRRAFTPHCKQTRTLRQPIMAFFCNIVVASEDHNVSDYDSVSSMSFDMCVPDKENSLMYSSIHLPTILGKRKIDSMKIRRPQQDQDGYLCHRRDPGAQTKRRLKHFQKIMSEPQQVPNYFYNSDDEVFKSKLMKKFNEQPLIKREVPFCTNCKLVRASVRQTKQTKKRMAKPVVRLTE